MQGSVKYFLDVWGLILRWQMISLISRDDHLAVECARCWLWIMIVSDHHLSPAKFNWLENETATDFFIVGLYISGDSTDDLIFLLLPWRDGVHDRTWSINHNLFLVLFQYQLKPSDDSNGIYKQQQQHDETFNSRTPPTQQQWRPTTTTTTELQRQQQQQQQWYKQQHR